VVVVVVEVVVVWVQFDSRREDFFRLPTILL